jgi:hypothetical protein
MPDLIDNILNSETAQIESIDLEAMMTAVGPLVEAAEVRQYDPEHWVVAFDEDLAVEVEHDVDLAKLVLTTPLGLPVAGEERAAYKMLLQVAALWRETGGLRMGLNPADDTVVQIYDVSLAGLDLEGLEVQLRNFVQTAVHARETLAGSVSGTPAEEAGELAGFMRV